MNRRLAALLAALAASLLIAGATAVAAVPANAGGGQTPAPSSHATITGW